MAATRKATSTKKTAPKKKTAEQPKKSAPSIAATVIASWPAVTTAERAELLAQFTDEQCETWANRTRSRDTLKDANKWLATINQVVRQLSPVEYHSTRLAFLAEQVLALEGATREAVPGAATEAERDARDTTLLRAQGVRTRLAAALTRTAGGREALRSRISAVAGDVRSAPGVIDQLKGLLEIANIELTRSPTASRVSGLSSALVSEAATALESLEAANTAAASGTIGVSDSAQTNRIEGRVLRELRLAWSSLREARERDGRIPVLVPGPALVRAFKLAEKEAPPAKPA